ncbi:MAG: type II toxin-antitoxin system ParD family antitoxin [Pirellulales bacterium]
MPYEFPPDVERLVRDQMASGKYQSEDDVLREALESLSAAEADIEAIRQALAELQAGDPGVELDEAIHLIRAKHRTASDA